MGNTKFKVGDKVRVVKANMNDKHEYIGDVLTIRSINPNAPYKRDEHYGVEEPCQWVFDVDELGSVEFSKADLKPGMVVENCDGTRYLFVNDKFANVNEWSNSKWYNDDLTHSNYEELSIVKVYTSTGYTLDTMLSNRSLTLIWERKEPVKEMTVAEIEKQLGYKVKIVDGE